MRNLALLALLFGCSETATQTVPEPTTQVPDPPLALRTRLPEVGWQVVVHGDQAQLVAQGAVLKVEGTMVTLAHGDQGHERTTIDWDTVLHWGQGGYVPAAELEKR